MKSSLPKQYLQLAGRALADHTLARLLAVSLIERIQVALHAGDCWWDGLIHAGHPRVVTCTGGTCRAESVLRALVALRESAGAGDDDWVLVHDMARPCVRVADIETLLAVVDVDGALLACPAVDSVKQAVTGLLPENRLQVTRVGKSLERDRIWLALTPQFFPFGELQVALQTALAAGHSVTDEAMAMELAGYRPRLMVGHRDNIKVTQPEDLPLAVFYLQQQGLEK
jgi:2-C-methyl-D-erythritol 4-phosphate cytidylyltransferase